MKKQTHHHTMGNGLITKSIAAVALLSALPCLALTCDELRSQVETKIRSTGVTQFSVTIADVAASAPGKVVGNCDLGSKKLLYVQTPTADGTNVAGVAMPSPDQKPDQKNEVILTECKPGFVSAGGNCVKP